MSTTPASPNRSVKRTAPSRQAEPLVHARAMTERELRAAATGIEHDDGRIEAADARHRRQVGEPTLLFAGDHPDGDPGLRLDVLEDGRLVSRGAKAGGPDRDDRDGALAARFLDHARDGCRRPLQGLGRDVAVGVQTLTEPGDLGPIDDDAPSVVRRRAHRCGT